MLEIHIADGNIMYFWVLWFVQSFDVHDVWMGSRRYACFWAASKGEIDIITRFKV